MTRTTVIIFSAICVASLTMLFNSCSSTPWVRNDDGITVRLGKRSDYPGMAVRLQVINDRIIRVTSVPEGTFPEIKSLMALPMLPGATEFTVENDEDKVILGTSLIHAVVSMKTGEVVFKDNEGSVILAEHSGGGKTFSRFTSEAETCYTVRQQFESPADEALYGLGSNQASFMNMKGKDADLFQYNTVAAVPFLVSNRNYGILWDNNSRTKFGDIREWSELSGMKLFDRDGSEGGITAVYAGRKDNKIVHETRRENKINYQFLPDLAGLPSGYDLNDGHVTWEGSFESGTSGIHKFVFTSAGYAKLWINGELIFDRWRQCWNTSSNYFTLEMDKGSRYALKIEWIPDGGESFIALKYLEPLDNEEQQRISFWSEVADQIDYYFITGSSMDEVISGYRTVTGKAPMMPLWAMGFWQSRERYKTQEELLGVAREYRKREIPFDNIVLDWQYWPIDKWGDHNFDPERFPDPDGMISALHDDLNANIMISVWPKYYVGTENYEAMNSRGWLYGRNVEKGQKDWLGYVSTFYDPFNADARKAFWEQINAKLYSRGVDAWWLDATEPDICSNLPMDERKALMNPTALGSAARYFNAYALVQAQSVWEGQRDTDPGERVFILTRAAFAGLQRYGAANWSGDIASRWHDMKAQIPCGVSLSMSGIPWWTMDIGGFAVESRYYDPGKEDLEEWRELMTRWHQFGTFVPLFRSHGQYPFREIFNTAPETHQAYKTMVDYNKMRYRLLPYIYSLAGQTYLNDYTIMRGLVMDFPSDPRVNDIDDQYMFGPAIMVNPVTEYRARSREVYLPAGCGWYDLSTGTYYAGGRSIMAEAPYSSIPLFIREGSVIPAGPDIQYTSEKPADQLMIFVYAGADGSFTLYEDEGANNNYESGALSLIPFTYSESDKTLTIGRRKGDFPGMIANRTFNIIIVSKDKPLGMDFDRVPDTVVSYQGEEIIVQLKN